MFTLKRSVLGLIASSYFVSSVSYGNSQIIDNDYIIGSAATFDNIEMDGFGDTIIVTETGRVTATPPSAGFVGVLISAQAANQSIEVNGVIESDSNLTPGIASTGANFRLVNNNLIQILHPSSNFRNYAVQLQGSKASFENNGIIRGATIDGSEAIQIQGNNTNIDNTGTITALGTSSSAINIFGINTAIRNRGTIEAGSSSGTATRNSGSIYIRTSANNTTLLNTGTVISKGNGIDSNVTLAAIRSEGNDFRLTNSGKLTTDGNFAYGIYASGDNARLNSSGNISTEGASSYGVIATGLNANIKNSGSITTAGFRSRAIYAGAGAANISNSGSLWTKNNAASALYAEGDDINISNAGQVFTQGSNSDGIYSDGDDITVHNTGTISTEGLNSRGIYANGANITNHNVIHTAGSNSNGVVFQGFDKTVDNHGQIVTTGSNSHAIYADTVDGVINNHGTLSATGTGSYAILGTDNTNTTLNLFAGSNIVGEIDLGGDGTDTDVVNVHMDGDNSAITIKNAEKINVTGNGIVNGNTIISLDGTSESSHSLALASTTESIHGVVKQRMLAKHKPQEPIQLASLTLAPSMLILQERKPMIWWQFFDGKASNDAKDGISAYETDHTGVVIGSEKERGRKITGLMLGIVNSDTVSSGLFDNSTNSIYVGTYVTTKRGWVNTSFSVLAGYTENSNKRTVNSNLHGTETAKADFNSIFISPSVSASARYTLTDSFDIQPSASLNYSLANLNEYTETGTTNANLTIGKRSLTSLTSTLQLASIYQFAKGYDATFTAGFSSRDTNDDDVNVSISNNQFRYSSKGNGTEESTFTGLDFNLVTNNDLHISIGFVSGGNSHKRYTNRHLDIKYPF